MIYCAFNLVLYLFVATLAYCSALEHAAKGHFSPLTVILWAVLALLLCGNLGHIVSLTDEAAAYRKMRGRNGKSCCRWTDPV